MQKSSKQPFFARFLESQDLPDASGACPAFTKKYPSDSDEGQRVTLKYPSDSDEGGPVTLKYPSDSDEHGGSQS